MRRLLALIVLICLLPLAALAEDRPRGLLWSRTDLPRTFPLQVKSNPGTDYLVTLTDTETGEAVLAAYIRGGEFFRVLVPPGRFLLDFASGPHWQGDESLFGPETKHFTLETPLTFEVTGTARKGGQIVDLRGPLTIATKTIGICQRFALDPESLRKQQPPSLRPPSLLPAKTSASDRSRTHPARDLPAFVVPYYDLSSRICD